MPSPTSKKQLLRLFVLREDFHPRADLLTDIVFRSAYPQKEMDREVEVVCDEIDS